MTKEQIEKIVELVERDNTNVAMKIGVYNDYSFDNRLESVNKNIEIITELLSMEVTK